MITAADLEQIAEQVCAEAELHPPRTPQRRALAHLHISLTIPPARTIASARTAIATFGDEQTQSDALELLEELVKEAP